MTRALPGFLLMLLFAAQACGEEDHDAVREAVAAGEIKPLAEILATVQARWPGRILDVELERARDGRRIYDIELIGPDGRKQDVHVDAASGRIIEAAPDAATSAAIRPLASITRELLARHPGLVTDVELDTTREGHAIYEIELLRSDGRTLELRVDAITGRMLEDAHAGGLPAVLPLPDVLERIAPSHPGDVIEVELERRTNGTPYYEIDVRGPDGRTLEVLVDAMTGIVLGHEEAD